MARSSISAANLQVGTDDGAVLISLIKGEQPHMLIELDWLTSLAGYDIHARLVECVTVEGKPTDEIGGVTRLLTKQNGYIIDEAPTDNKFVMVMPYDLCAGLAQQPTPAYPAYMFIDLEIGTAGTGNLANPIGQTVLPSQQVWKPLRGLVEIRYSTTEL